MRRARRTLYAAAAALAATLLVAPASDRAQGPEPAPAARPAEASFARTAARGAPVAILARRTWLRAAPGGRRVALLRRRTEWKSPRVLAAVGARGRWLRVIATELPSGRTGWIPLRGASLVANPWAIAVDLSERTVEVSRRGRVVRRFLVGVGRPRTPTPTGRFGVTDKLEIAGGSPAYGCCALALTGHQTHIEPGWRGGDRLAIHGTRLTATIGDAASFGCLRARDRDVRWLVRRVFLGTIVSIRH